MKRRIVKPKYVQLKEELMGWIFGGKLAPGDRLPSENELAQQFGMSRQTVRQAISDLVHDNLLYTEQGRGTFVSAEIEHATPISSQSHIIGVITTYISDYIFPSIIRGIESQLTPEGYSILLLSTHNDFKQEAHALKTVIQKGVDGLIIEPTKSASPNPNLEFYFSLVENHIPFVMLHSSYLELTAPTLRVDDEEGEFLATMHLVERGHKRIGGIFKSDDLQGKFRLKGFLKALKAGGVDLAPELLSLYNTSQRFDIAEQYVQLIVSRLTDEHRPTAIACYNDEIAMGVVKHLRAHQIRVPDDIAVVGFDDSQYAEASDLGLTTIQHPKFDMGARAASSILDLIKNGDTGSVDNDFVFKPCLIVRSST